MNDKGLFENLFAFLSITTKQSCSEQVDLEAPDYKDSFSTRYGGQVSFLELRGISAILSEREQNEKFNMLASSLAPYLGRKGRAIDWIMNYHADAREELERLVEPSRRAFASMGLPLENILDDQVEILSRFCSSESVLIAIWTDSTIFSPQEREQAFQGLKERPPEPFEAQRIGQALDQLRQGHDAAVQGVLKELRHIGFIVSRLDHREAMRTIHSLIEDDGSKKTYTPALPGDSNTVRIEDARYPEDALAPRLGEQLFRRDYDQDGGVLRRKDGRLYATGYFNLAPQNMRDINRLMNRIDHDIPWRLRIRLEGGGIMEDFEHTLRSMYSSIFAFLDANNRAYRDASRALKAILEDDAVTKCRLRVGYATWADRDDRDTLESRRSRLTTALESWGSPEPRDDMMDPIEGLIGTLPVTPRMVAPKTPETLHDAVTLLPVMRAAPPWSSGSLLMRTPGGRPWPIMMGSSRQSQWLNVITGTPGYGKSVLVAAILFAFIGMPGNRRLPPVCHIDIGPSQKGWADYLRAVLEEQGRGNEIMYHKMVMNEKHAINFFDVSMGFRRPSPMEFAFIVNTLLELSRPSGRESPYENAEQMLNMLIERLFEAYASSEAKLYKPGLVAAIDVVIEDWLPEDPEEREYVSWFDVRDVLFEREEYALADRAHRLAMPLLSDAITFLKQDPTILNKWSTVPVDGSSRDNLIDAVERNLTSALSKFPVFRRETQVDLSGSRLRYIDLQAVAPRGSDENERQTRIMAMLALHIGARDFFMGEEDEFRSLVEDLPLMYRDYHWRRYRDRSGQQAMLSMDEVHRFCPNGEGAVANQLDLYSRENRKDEVQMTLASQNDRDIPPSAIDYASNIYRLSSGKKESRDAFAKRLGLNKASQEVIATRLLPPDSKGSNIFAYYEIDEGEGCGTMALKMTQGARFLWISSSKKPDRQIRSRLYRRLGPIEAINELGRRYPSGSIREEIEARGFDMDDEIPEDFFGELEETIAQEVIARRR